MYICLDMYIYLFTYTYIYVYTCICLPLDVDDRVKLFLCHGIGESPVGIRTSQDWDHTHWGTQIPSLPGMLRL